MSKSILKTPFNKLPEALVEDMLNQCDGISRKLSSTFQKLLNHKKEARTILKDEKLLRKDSEITSTPYHPTTCGIDGAFAIEKLLSTDIVEIAGLKNFFNAVNTRKINIYKYLPIQIKCK